jgi:hypothetical protein
MGNLLTRIPDNAKGIDGRFALRLKQMWVVLALEENVH